MPSPAVPAADAKIGAKIDYVARLLGDRLKPLGFKRTARKFLRSVGDGAGACVQLIDLQGDRWNEGARGKFTVNLGVCFPALLELQAKLPGLEWVAEHVKPGQFAYGPGGFQCRLGDTVPAERDARWPEALRHGEDFWAEIDARTDLAMLAEAIGEVLATHALRWLDERSRLEAFGAVDSPGLGTPGPRDAALAALLQGDVSLAVQRVLAAPVHMVAQNAEQLAGLVALLRERGGVVEDLSWESRPAHPMHQRRSVEVDALKTTHDERVEAFLRDGNEWSGREDALLDAWIDAVAAAQLQTDVRKLPLWTVVQQAPVSARRKLLLRAIERLPEPGPTVKSTVANIWASYDNYHLHAWMELAKALLAQDDESCDPAYAKALLHGLTGTVQLVHEDLGSDRFRTPLVAVVRWLGRNASTETRHAVRGEIRGLIEAIRHATVVRRHERGAVPPPIDLIGPELHAQLAALYTPEARAKADAFHEQFPERAYAADDRDAVMLLKRWVRAEPDGRVPLALESDDWGKELSSALDALPVAERNAWVQMLEWFDTGVDAKPSKRWWTELQQRVPALDRAAVIHWLAETLPRFARSSLDHCAAAPGIGAFPGETSGRALLGLVHLAGSLACDELASALQTVASSAFTLIPGQRLRAQSIGTACLEPLARSVEGREFLRRLEKTVRQKPVKKAILDALDASKT